MVKKAVHVKQGDLSTHETPVFMLREPKSRAAWAGVRAAIGASKRRNGRGAKGRRKVKA
jgi:hypothetical protein